MSTISIFFIKKYSNMGFTKEMNIIRHPVDIDML